MAFIDGPLRSQIKPGQGGLRLNGINLSLTKRIDLHLNGSAVQAENHEWLLVYLKAHVPCGLHLVGRFVL